MQTDITPFTLQDFFTLTNNQMLSILFARGLKILVNRFSDRPGPQIQETTSSTQSSK